MCRVAESFCEVGIGLGGSTGGNSWAAENAAAKSKKELATISKRATPDLIRGKLLICSELDASGFAKSEANSARAITIHVA
jgi:hypothetical protein